MAEAEVDTLLEEAQQRAREKQRAYEGDLTPAEAYALLRQVPNAQLVDVRTHAEREFVGYPTLGTHVEWETYPGMVYNPDFPEQLRGEVGTDPDQLLLFLCRSGGRSAKAAEAMTRQGYRRCFNVIEGFEGHKDEAKHRSTRDGWKLAGLPWEQK